MIVTKDSSGDLQGETENNIAFLDYNEDDRHCWTTSMMINKKALDKL